MVDDPNPKFVFAEEQALFPSIACLPSFYFRAQAMEGGSSWDGRGLLRSFVRRALLLRWSLLPFASDHFQAVRMVHCCLAWDAPKAKRAPHRSPSNISPPQSGRVRDSSAGHWFSLPAFFQPTCARDCSGGSGQPGGLVRFFFDPSQTGSLPVCGIQKSKKNGRPILCLGSARICRSLVLVALLTCCLSLALFLVLNGCFVIGDGAPAG